MISKKVPLGGPFRTNASNKTRLFSYWTAPCRDPVFYETIVITVPLGPSRFLNVRWGMKIGSFYVLSAFLCVNIYITFSIFYNTTVNVDALNIPILKKRPTFQTMCVTLCWCFAFAFLLLSHMCVDFRVPAATPLGHTSPIYGRCWYHV